MIEILRFAQNDNYMKSTILWMSCWSAAKHLIKQRTCHPADANERWLRRQCEISIVCDDGSFSSPKECASALSFRFPEECCFSSLCSDEGSKKTRMIEILCFAQNDNPMKSIILCVMLERSTASHKKVKL